VCTDCVAIETLDGGAGFFAPALNRNERVPVVTGMFEQRPVFSLITYQDVRHLPSPVASVRNDYRYASRPKRIGVSLVAFRNWESPMQV
jgi:hypothetical protein